MKITQDVREYAKQKGLKMVRKHLTVKMKPDDPRYALLPDNYLANAESVETPCLLIMGDSKPRILRQQRTLHC